VLAAPDGAVHRYAKIHPFWYGTEPEHYAAGETFLSVDVEGVRCTFFICYDLRFADEFWALADQTDCYVIPANWPASRREHWMALLRARAIENQAYVVGVNRVGVGGKLRYTGDSMIIDPFGEVVAQAGQAETTITANVDPERVRTVRAEYPFLQDRRSVT
jgi:predicted amidohydrolase